MNSGGARGHQLAYQRSQRGGKHPGPQPINPSFPHEEAQNSEALLIPPDRLTTPFTIDHLINESEGFAHLFLGSD